MLKRLRNSPSQSIFSVCLLPSKKCLTKKLPVGPSKTIKYCCSNILRFALQKLESGASLKEFATNVSIQTYFTTRNNIKNLKPHFVEKIKDIQALFKTKVAYKNMYVIPCKRKSLGIALVQVQILRNLSLNTSLSMHQNLLQWWLFGLLHRNFLQHLKKNLAVL